MLGDLASDIDDNEWARYLADNGITHMELKSITNMVKTCSDIIRGDTGITDIKQAYKAASDKAATYVIQNRSNSFRNSIRDYNNINGLISDAKIKVNELKGKYGRWTVASLYK